MSNNRRPVIFMGSPPFAVPALEALVAARDFEVVHVVTQPDRPKGRGMRLSPTEVKRFAASAGIPVAEMDKTSYAEVSDRLQRLRPDFIVVAAFGMILRSNLLELPRLGCVNLHASLLPRYRGVAPIQAAILAGDAVTGCTTMAMDEGVDTGDVLLTATTAIEPTDTAGTLEAKLSRLGAPLVMDTLRGLLRGEVVPRPQEHDAATFTKRIRKEHGRIDWERDVVAIERQVRAMTPWPSAYTGFGGRRLIVLEARVGGAGPGAGRPGEVVSTSPFLVAAGDGVLELRRVKVEGRREMPVEAFLAGYRLKAGSRFA